MENYFDIFGIPVQWATDNKALKKKYYELSRASHPDMNIGEKNDSLEKSALLNKAYKTLSDPDSCIGHALEVLGAIRPDEKFQLPSDFLMEVMEINEQLQETKAAGGNLGPIVQSGMSMLASEKASILDFLSQQPDPNNLEPVKSYFYKKKYLARILESVR